MIKPNERTSAGPKHALPSGVTTRAVRPSTLARGGPTRVGHSNGLRIHAIVFGAISLGVLIVLGVTLMIIGRM